MRILPCYFLFTLTCFVDLLLAQSNQINIARIAMMPNQPAPYNLRDWHQVALQYDSFVYDLNKTGQYLPLVSLNPSGINYPLNQTFQQHTYVGTNSPNGNEAINVLPSLVGASLVGVDKSNQFGQNWLMMSREFFNKANGEHIYLNNAGANSGSDWWYDLMPNVFFYQLYDLYSSSIDAETKLQFNSIADQFLKAVRTMGGSDIPWKKANMDYRAWKFKTMQSNANGVHEPEAAGAYAWLLYHAYKKTGNPEYLKGAEWAIEFLNEWPTNPSYELQLPYGTYTAAKMNAELGTNYDIEKMLNWSFNRGALRGWGTIVGNWGGFDVSGLVGEANDAGNDYAFQLNGVQQAVALVPMTRYDKRFARSIGKWVINLSNAMRLYYPGFLSTNMQDASAWSMINDPQHVIGYEALRQKWQNLSPFSTGDAVQGGWAATNLALYGTSSIGYLGAIIKKTNVDKIIQLDLLKTDFFGSKAYPTFLFYNSYSTSQTIQFDMGSTSSDLYESLSEKFILKNSSGLMSLTIPANEAVIVSICPANGIISFKENKMMVNDVVVDFNQHAQVYTHAPRIKALSAIKNPLQINDSTTVYATVFDADSGQLTYQWYATDGRFSGSGATINYKSSASPSNVIIKLIVTDPEGNSDTSLLQLSIVSKINEAPQIIEIQKSTAYVATNKTIQLNCIAIDPNNDPITYTWSANAGSFVGNGNTIEWTAPSSEGIYQINVKVTDDGGLSALSTTSMLVKNFNAPPGHLIAQYPFSGNANDISGNQLHGQANGAILTVDKNGNQLSAYYFNGGAQHIEVANNSLLNFQDGITVSCWFKANALPDKENFLLSHGSWQNRWKLSITPDKYVRWTVNTISSIGDLDCDVPIQIDSFYHLAVTYDGNILAMYLNGNLHSYKVLSGKIRTTTYSFLMGQMLQGISDYNFKGVLDEVKIFDYAINPNEAKNLYNKDITFVKNIIFQKTNSLTCYPNPVVDFLIVQFPLDYIKSETIKLKIFDLLGKKVYEQEVKYGIHVELDLRKIKPGVYMLSSNSIYSNLMLKFIKI